MNCSLDRANNHGFISFQGHTDFLLKASRIAWAINQQYFSIHPLRAPGRHPGRPDSEAEDARILRVQ